MKKTTIFLLGLIMILVLAACGTAGEMSTDAAATAVNTAETNTTNTASVTTTGEVTAVSLTEDYAEDALPIRSQLLVGTLKLEDTDLAVTLEQASELLILWQASATLSRSGTGASEEVTAVINQIQATMTPEQIAAIADMQLTREDIQAISQEMGLSTGSGEGAGSGNRGQGQNMTAEEIATREVERANNASIGATNALLDTLIDLLTSRRES